MNQLIPELTILIPTRNRPNDLRVCLESVIKGFGHGQKVVIGDNGDATITAEVVRDFPGLIIQHILNPPGSTYVQNLDKLFRSCQTEWLSVIHDDDFFEPTVGMAIRPLLQDPLTDFIFSDHWVSQSDGTIDVDSSEQFSKQYGRNQLNEGIQPHAGLLAINQRIALDGFFIKKTLACSRELDLSQAIASDLKWLVEVCDRSLKTIYLQQRIFTYRLSAISLTSTANPIETAFNSWRTMRRTEVVRSETLLALKQIQRRSLIRIILVIPGGLKHFLSRLAR